MAANNRKIISVEISERQAIILHAIAYERRITVSSLVANLIEQESQQREIDRKI